MIDIFWLDGEQDLAFFLRSRFGQGDIEISSDCHDRSFLIIGYFPQGYFCIGFSEKYIGFWQPAQ